MLRENGFGGWGGKSLEKRMQGYRSTIRLLLNSDFFPKKGAQILELGSGAGDSLIPLAKKEYMVTGIEISLSGVQWAKEKFEKLGLNARFIHGNIAEAFPFDDDVFDAVLDAACLHCIIGCDRNKALKESFRVLKKGGFFLVSHMVNDPRELNAETVFNPINRVQEFKGFSYRTMPTFLQLCDEIRLAGFDIVKKIVRQNSWWDHAEIWCLKS